MLRSDCQDIFRKKDLQTYQEDQSILNLKLRNSITLKMNANQQNYSNLKRKAYTHQFYQAEKGKLLRRSLQMDQDLKWREEIWDQREMDFKKSIRKVTLRKRNGSETLALIMLLIFAFLSALYMAPNQFYKQENK